MLGDLAAGSSTTTLDLLVNKWFYGLDHPQAVHEYGLASGTLFGPGDEPVFSDVYQGGAIDCYFLSTLATTAVQMPQIIKDMFIDNGDNTYTVRFYQPLQGKFVADYVTVDLQFPVSSNGYFVYDNNNHLLTDSTNVLWVALAEKAYAQINEGGWLGHTYDCNDADDRDDMSCLNSYAAINFGDPGKATGNVAALNAKLIFTTSFDDTTFAELWADGNLIAIGTKTVPDQYANDVVANHAYAMVGYDSDSHTITLFNPHGLDNPDDKNRLEFLYLTSDQLADYGFAAWSYTQISG